MEAKALSEDDAPTHPQGLPRGGMAPVSRRYVMVLRSVPPIQLGSSIERLRLLGPRADPIIETSISV
jgi:hypothetical protein